MSFFLVALVMVAEKAAFSTQPDIYLEVHKGPSNPNQVFFLAPHENEHVVNAYLKEQVKKRGGCFLILRQDGERLLKLKLGDASYEVDPNRIFSPRGAKKSLLRENPGLKEGDPVFAKLQRRAAAIGRWMMAKAGGMNKGSVMVAIHNNTDGYDHDGKGGEGTISIDRYQKLQKRGAAFIKDVFVGRGDEDDLFFLTDPGDFEAAKAAGFHAILQHPQVARLEDEDDGSLSVIAEKKGVRYFNIEAQRKPGDDHLKEQIAMTEFVLKLVFAKP